MIPYRETPDEFRAQHLEGCRLAPDHAGACLLARPFRFRPEGGREYLDAAPEQSDDDSATAMPTTGPDTRQRAEEYVRDALGDHADAHDVPTITDALHEHAGRSWDLSQVPADRFWAVVQAHALPELTAASSVAEVRWVASEARALASVDDPERRARFLARKRALLAYIEATTGVRS